MCQRQAQLALACDLLRCRHAMHVSCKVLCALVHVISAVWACRYGLLEDYDSIVRSKGSVKRIGTLLHRSTDSA